MTTTVGIVGGLGPLAGAAFYQCLVASTPAGSDGEHLGVVLLSNPDLPSRVSHLLGNGPSPLPGLLAMVSQLDALGADLIAIPSGTTHAYYAQLQPAARAPIVNVLTETAAVVAAHRVSRLGLLATGASVRLSLYEPGAEQVYEVSLPDAPAQRDIDDIIGAIKAGRPLPDLAGRLHEIMGRPWAAACDAFLLACTELHLLRPMLTSGSPVLDATQILVDAVLRESGLVSLGTAVQAGDRAGERR